MIYDTIVIGAGAAGLIGAIHAGADGQKVLILEKMSSPGRKLLITGNGKCNLTNENLSIDNYHTDDRAGLSIILKNYPPSALKEEFGEMGLYLLEKDGRIYPRSLDSRSVLRTLLNSIRIRNIGIECNKNMRKIEFDSGHFIIKTENDTYLSKKIILTSGGMSYRKTGSSGDGYYHLKKFGHSVIKQFPALSPLYINMPGLDFSGIRQIGRAGLIINGEEIKNEIGEIQFRKSAISGIPVMNMSHDAIICLDNGDRVSFEFDFLPEEDMKKTEEKLLRRAKNFKVNDEISSLDFFNGICQSKLTEIIMRLSGIEIKPVRELKNSEIRAFSEMVHSLKVPVEGSPGWNEAQVTSGGIPLSEVNPHTMESIFHKGLFIAGEILNCDGECGGYNLHFAFASGRAAGDGAVKQS